MNTTNEITMLPCPFCGGNPVEQDNPRGGKLIRCQSCQTTAFTGQWNHRVNPTPISNDALYGYSKVTDPAYKAEQKTRNQEMREAVDSMSNDASMESSKSNTLPDVNDKNVADIKDAVEVALSAYHSKMFVQGGNDRDGIKAALSAAYPALVKERDALRAAVACVYDLAKPLAETNGVCGAICEFLEDKAKITKGGA